MNYNSFDAFQHTTGEPIKCPVCGSLEWDCWDERTEEIGTTTEDGHEYIAIIPVGYLKCPNGHAYTHSW